ncbi:MAG: GNAT family N-acetyltransferase [Fastidiosipilaceae bacterium]|jgi:L-amino acid N-acyltransferase YncA
MNTILRPYRAADLTKMIDIWNEIVEEGIAFPQEEMLTVESGEAFFASQTHCGVAEDSKSGDLLGLYILHPNNVGRCGHISNASYAVRSELRGRGIGELLVRDCLEQAAAHGFTILQFNAVVRTNAAAIHLYEKLGFNALGTIPGGFLLKDGTYEDIIVFFRQTADRPHAAAHAGGARDPS